MVKIEEFKHFELDLHKDSDLDKLESEHGGVYYMSFCLDDIYNALSKDGCTALTIYSMKNGWYFALLDDIREDITGLKKAVSNA